MHLHFWSILEVGWPDLQAGRAWTLDAVTAHLIYQCRVQHSLPQKYMQVGSKAGEDVPPGVKLCHYAHTGGECVSARSRGANWDGHFIEKWSNWRMMRVTKFLRVILMPSTFWWESQSAHFPDEKETSQKRKHKSKTNTHLSAPQYMLSMFHSRNPSRKTPREV